MAGIVLVKDVMSKDVQVERADSSIREVVIKMNKFDIGSLIITQEKRPVGIITERDILRRIIQGGIDANITKAREIMSSPVTTITEEASIEEAAKLMAQKGIKRLLVVRDNKLVGIISSTDLVKAQPTVVGLLEELLSRCPPPETGSKK